MINVLIFTQADGKELLSVTSQADRIFIQTHLKLSQQITTHWIHLNNEKVKLPLQKSDLSQVNWSSLS